MQLEALSDCIQEGFCGPEKSNNYAPFQKLFQSKEVFYYKVYLRIRCFEEVEIHTVGFCKVPLKGFS